MFLKVILTMMALAFTQAASAAYGDVYFNAGRVYYDNGVKIDDGIFIYDKDDNLEVLRIKMGKDGVLDFSQVSNVRLTLKKHGSHEGFYVITSAKSDCPRDLQWIGQIIQIDRENTSTFPLSMELRPGRMTSFVLAESDLRQLYRKVSTTKSICF